jgi:sortase B
MRNGTMFADLHKYEKKAFWENHRYVNFDTLHEYRTYEIFAIFKTTADLTKGFTYHIYDTFATEKAFNEYVSTCKNLSLYDTGITPDFGDKLLTLSTCDKSISDGRLVVVCRLVGRYS